MCRCIGRAWGYTIEVVLIMALFVPRPDPSIKPVPSPEVDPTMFEKRFLKKIRELGEVKHTPSLCTVSMDVSD